MSVPDQREILIAHDPSRGPLTALRRMLIQSSIAELKEFGLYDRYCSKLDAATLSGITDHIGPGWIPVQLAMAHYQACDELGLGDEQLATLGARAGATLASNLLVTSAKISPWEAIHAFWRMGRRINEGGSSQYVKLGPTRLQIESLGNPLQTIAYYRLASLGFYRSAFGALGVQVREVKIMSYRAPTGSLDVRISWTPTA